jgi:hypothetical protein
MCRKLLNIRNVYSFWYSTDTLFQYSSLENYMFTLLKVEKNPPENAFIDLFRIAYRREIVSRNSFYRKKTISQVRKCERAKEDWTEMIEV